MTLIEIFSLVMLLIVAAVMIADSILFSLSYRSVKDADPKIKVKNKNAVTYFLMMVISVMFILIDLINLSSSIEGADLHTARSCLYFIFAWAGVLVLWMVSAIFSRSSYVTTDGVLTIGFMRRKIPTDVVTYRINGDILELYRKNKKRYTYKIIDEKGELEELMKVHYKSVSTEPEKPAEPEKTGSTSENEKEKKENENI